MSTSLRMHSTILGDTRFVDRQAASYLVTMNELKHRLDLRLVTADLHRPSARVVDAMAIVGFTFFISCLN